MQICTLRVLKYFNFLTTDADHDNVAQQHHTAKTTVNFLLYSEHYSI